MHALDMQAWQNQVHLVPNMQAIHVMQFIDAKKTKKKKREKEIKHGMLIYSMSKQQLNVD